MKEFSAAPVEKDRLCFPTPEADFADAVHDDMLLGSNQSLETERAANTARSLSIATFVTSSLVRDNSMCKMSVAKRLF